ncbi:DUF1538 family protein [Vibrio sp. WXL210]|uniref:DUF1538 family protein n=1 Tax=Vibrio sp. WXL210 TaxID=3450709 RepID=UPI003EC6013F
MRPLKELLLACASSFKDLLPIILVVAFFQLVVLQRPLPYLLEVTVGLVLVVLGLTLFVFGLELGLFPIGESMAQAFAQKGSVGWLLLFSFCLGFGTTVAEPALTAVSNEASLVAAKGGMIENSEQQRSSYAFWLKITVAISVGSALVVGVLRILKGWSIQWMIIGGYVLVVVLTFFAPQEIIGIAYDSGGVTTSTITVPLVTALGVGLSSSIKGRSPLVDGFGLIAFASLVPMMFVMVFGMWVNSQGAVW